MKVLKFGGSVLKNVNDIKNICNIVLNDRENNEKIIAVCSAFYGITNKLVSLYESLKQKQEKHNDIFEEIKTFHLSIINELNIKDSSIPSLLNELNDIINNFNINDNTLKQSDLILSFGERLSSSIFFEVLTQAYKCNAVKILTQKIIKTDSNFGNAKINVAETKKLTKTSIHNAKADIIVCAGFIASNAEDKITTLGRNGSDCTASIIASIIKATKLEIWKDTDGLFTADPKIVDNVKFIEKISYQEMAELSSLGNKVIHIDAIAPCITANIPILLKNCYNPTGPGTLITKHTKNSKNEEKKIINGIVKFDGIQIITIKVNELIQMTDFSIKMQVLLQDFSDDIITISQNIKQKLFAIIVSASKTDLFLENVKKTFPFEVSNNNITFNIGERKTMITIVGADMVNMTGISGKIFSILEKNKINVDTIHDDFSTTRISFVCNTDRANEAIRLLHKGLVED